MINRSWITALVLLVALVLMAAHGAPSQDGAERLGKDLTPIGAIKAGNKDGSIPPWTGGLTKPVAGWKSGDHYIDPFPGEIILI